MGKLFKLGIISLSSLVLVACGGAEGTGDETAKGTSEETTLIEESEEVESSEGAEVESEGDVSTTVVETGEGFTTEVEDNYEETENPDGSVSGSASVDLGAVANEEALQALEEDPTIPVLKESELTEEAMESVQDYDRFIIESEDGEKMMLMETN